jgi:hypothetical protein
MDVGTRISIRLEMRLNVRPSPVARGGPTDTGLSLTSGKSSSRGQRGPVATSSRCGSTVKTSLTAPPARVSSSINLAVVNEPQSLAMHSCGRAPEPIVTCNFGSQRFSSFHAVFGAHVPSMRPARPGEGSRLRGQFSARCPSSIDDREATAWTACDPHHSVKPPAGERPTMSASSGDCHVVDLHRRASPAGCRHLRLHFDCAR